MIVGIGVDVIEVERIERVLRRQGDAFLRHVFTEAEQSKAPENTTAAASYYAGRWSAKEAVAKALGTGIGEACGWRDIDIIRWPSGQPAVTLSGAAAKTAESRGIKKIHLTISHEKRLACASAVAEG